MQSVIEAHHRFTYRGIACLKNPYDLALYQMLLSRLRPDLIVEIGTHAGGSALYFADLCQCQGHGIVHTIDPNPAAMSALAWSHPRIKAFAGSWEDYPLPSGPGICLVIDDGSHSHCDVLGALRRFSPVAAYYVVEDATVVPEADRATNEFLASDNRFCLDDELANFWGEGLTFNRYLRINNQ